MDSTNRRTIEVELEGSPQDGGAVRLDEFQQFLENWIQTLKQVEMEVNGGKNPTTVYRVIELSYQSPVRCRVEAIPGANGKRRPDFGPAVASRFEHDITLVNQGVAPEGIRPKTLERMAQLTTVLRKHVSAIRFNPGTDGALEIPANFDTKVKEIIGNVYRSHGTFRGRLEALNLHSNPSTLYIYPVAGPTKVRCYYKKGEIQNIGDYLNRMVEVSGVKKFRGEAPHPFEIEIRTLRLIPSQADLPKTDEIVGCMPDLTDGLDAVSYLRKIRNEEDLT